MFCYVSSPYIFWVAILLFIFLCSISAMVFGQKLSGFSLGLLFGPMIFDQSHDQTWLLIGINYSNE